MSTTSDVAVKDMTRGLSMISLKSILPNAKDIRVASINGMPYMSIRDLIMAICGQNNNRASETWRNLPEKRKNKIQGSVLNFQFPGRGQSLQPVIALSGLLRLVMALPTDAAQDVRIECCEILARHLSGDPTLAAETAHNASIGVAAACEAFLGQALLSGNRMRETKPELGYVYGTVSDAFPDLIKIGHTGNLDARLRSMNTSCAPLPHRFVAVAPTYYPIRDEKVAHAYFDAAREEGEFFRVTVEELQTFMDRYITLEYNEGCKKRLASSMAEYSEF